MTNRDVHFMTLYLQQVRNGYETLESLRELLTRKETRSLHREGIKAAIDCLEKRQQDKKGNIMIEIGTEVRVKRPIDEFSEGTVTNHRESDHCNLVQFSDGYQDWYSDDELESK